MSIWNFKMKFLFLVYIVYNYVKIFRRFFEINLAGIVIIAIFVIITK